MSGLYLIADVRCSRYAEDKTAAIKRGERVPSRQVEVFELFLKGMRTPACFCLVVYSCYDSRSFLCLSPQKEKRNAFLLMNLVRFSLMNRVRRQIDFCLVLIRDVVHRR